MKLKRMLFVFSLIVLALCCYAIMNRRYDELARYPYATTENREIILQYLNTDDINYICDQRIEPNEFLPFIDKPGFDIHNTMWYATAKNAMDQDNAYIVSFINTYRTKMNYRDLGSLIRNYGYETLATFYDNNDIYVKDAQLIVDPSLLQVDPDDKHTLFRYVPNNLVNAADIPHENMVEGEERLLIREEVVEPLRELCTAAEEINGNTCGNMVLTTGYLSYDEQVPLYKQALLQYGPDGFSKYVDYPGRSEFQTGYMVTFTAVGNDPEVPAAEQQQARWLSENAWKYGFIVRYSKAEETKSGKLEQPYTLRYVGKKHAKTMMQEHILFEDMEWKNE